MTIRAPAELTATIETWAEMESIVRSEAVRQLIEAGLRTKPPVKVAKRRKRQ